MYFEIFHERKLIKRGKDLLNNPSWANELMYTPSTILELPIYYREFLNGHDEVKLFVNGKCFWGIIVKLVEDKADETIRAYLEHVISEWEYRQISVNNAIKDQNINVVFKGAIVEKTGTVSVSGNDFNLYIPEVGHMDLAHYIERSGASAWEENGDPVEIVSVDDSAITMIPEDYDLIFSTANGETVTVTVSVVRLPNSSTREYEGITLCATAFEIGYDENLSNEDYIERAYALAWDEEGNPVDLWYVEPGVGSEPGEYDVTFYVNEDLHLTITVTRVEEGEDPADTFPFIKPWIVDPSVIDELSDIYADTNFAYPGWIINYGHGAEDRIIDYVYSRQDKLEALTRTMELTEDLYWRVRFVNERALDISPFGDQKQWIFSIKPSGINNIRIIEEPEITHEFEHVINVATVYSEKSDTGMSSMTLREVYNDPSLQIEGFPVVIIQANVNNERDYRMYSTQYPKLAPNNELEYAIIDEESVALEGGVLIEGTFAFDDLSPFQIETDEYGKGIEVSDEDRIKAAQTAYEAAIKRLKQTRRRYTITVVTEEIPADLAPGDMVRLIYDNSIYITEECSAYLKKILGYDDWFYIERITYDFDENGVETNSVTLSKFLQVPRLIDE